MELTENESKVFETGDFDAYLLNWQTDDFLAHLWKISNYKKRGTARAYTKMETSALGSAKCEPWVSELCYVSIVDRLQRPQPKRRESRGELIHRVN